MRALLQERLAGVPLTGDLAQDVDALLRHHGRERTREHTPRVARLAHDLASREGLDADLAETAALLHDIGGVFDRAAMVEAALALGEEVLREERLVPMIVHQKLSTVMAREVFGVTDARVLQAIRHHTTLHAAPTLLDEVVFVADKVEWDGDGEPPYKAELLAALRDGVPAAARWMVGHLWAERERLLVVHPWLEAARRHYERLRHS